MENTDSTSLLVEFGFTTDNVRKENHRDYHYDQPPDDPIW